MIRVSWVLRILLPWEVRAICGPPGALSVPHIFKLFASSTFRRSMPHRKHSTACPPLRTDCPIAFENCFQTFTTFFRSWAGPLDGRGEETDGVAVPIDRRTGAMTAHAAGFRLPTRRPRNCPTSWLVPPEGPDDSGYFSGWSNEPVICRSASSQCSRSWPCTKPPASNRTYARCCILAINCGSRSSRSADFSGIGWRGAQRRPSTRGSCCWEGASALLRLMTAFLFPPFPVAAPCPSRT